MRHARRELSSVRWPPCSLLLHAWVCVDSLVHLCLLVDTCIILLPSRIVTSYEGNNITPVSPQLIAVVLFYFLLYFFFASTLQTSRTSSNQFKNECEGGTKVKIFLEDLQKQCLCLACQQECIDIVKHL